MIERAEIGREIKKITITAERKGAGHQFRTLHSDVFVQFDNGDEYLATFFSTEAIKGMIEKERKTKKYASGRYYKLLNAVMVSDLNNGDLFSIIEQMVAEGDFQLAFRKI